MYCPTPLLLTNYDRVLFHIPYVLTLLMLTFCVICGDGFLLLFQCLFMFLIVHIFSVLWNFFHVNYNGFRCMQIRALQMTVTRYFVHATLPYSTEFPS